MPHPTPFLACLLSCSLAGCTGNQGELLTVAAAVVSAAVATQAARGGGPGGAPPAGGLPTVTAPGSGTATTASAAPAAAAAGPADPQLAMALAATNAARAADKLVPLTWSQPLAVVALRHSQDMADRGYFDHTSLDGRSPFDRMKAAGIAYGAASENIAQNFSPAGDEVVAQWLASPGHRANILDPASRKMGLGVVKDARGQHLWTQTFTD